MTTEATRRWSNFAWTALTYILVFLLVFPVLWMALTGFKTEIAAINISPILFFQPTLDQFRLAIEGGFGSYLFNSAAAALVSTALAMVLGIPAAYAMVFHMPTKSSNDMLFFVLTRLNLLDNLFVLIVIYTAMNLPLIIWMARSYFLELPKEVLEGAWLDGCTTFQTIVRIVVPMAAPGLTAAALLAIIFAWNDFFFAVTLTYTNSPTLPIMVAAFTSNEGLFLARVSALATLIILVPVAIGIYAQRYLVQGLTGGALK